jgi:class 3 adenylate cyclase
MDSNAERGAKPIFSCDSHPPEEAIIAAYDLEGFTTFCSDAVAKGDGERQRILTQALAGIQEFLLDQYEQICPRFRPKFTKWTGDGGFLIWPVTVERTQGEEIVRLVRQIQKFNREKAAKWRVQPNNELVPERIRVGIN